MKASVMPGLPFNVRDADKINKELGCDALPHSVVAVPIFVFNNDDILDDVSYDGCPYIEDTESANFYDDKVYRDFDWMKEQDRKPI